jgi:hypothetical protein
MIRGNPVVTTALVGLGFIAFLLGCATSDDSTAAIRAELAACGLDDGSIEHGGRLHACDPNDHKKTTICHIPPGNPANAHTICVGNAAVPAHLNNHGDHVGACVDEPPCPPPATGAAGTGDATGAAGSGDVTGAAGSGAAGMGAAGTGDVVIVP